MILFRFEIIIELLDVFIRVLAGVKSADSFYNLVFVPIFPALFLGALAKATLGNETCVKHTVFVDS